jgi:hypothetical protein
VDFDPIEGLRGAVHRKTLRGEIYEADQRITLDEALTMYTRGSAEVAGCLGERGTLAPGKRADLVVMNGPLTEPSDLEDIQVVATVVGGELLFGQLGAAVGRI